MESSGRVMNLEGKQQSEALASSVLIERQYYVLLRVCREYAKFRKYFIIWKRVKNKLQQGCNFGLLRKLSNPDKERDRKIRGRTQRSQTRSKNISANNKHHLK
uniref:Uncharacterized protein n=1 Tax=Sander lucioperca TaxID=283035 RepID=A0A8C9XRH6_SANLU